MIQVTKLNMQQFMINEDYIESIQTTPNTIITMTTGAKFVVNESKEVIYDMIIDYKRQMMLSTDR